MTRISRHGSLLPTLLTFAAFAIVGGLDLVAPSTASAQCAPDADFCAEVRGPHATARVQVRRGRRPVVVQPAPPPPAPPPPPVVVQPTPPPPQRVVVVQPAPPPPQRVVVVQPAPQPVYQPYQPQPVYQPVTTEPVRRRWTMDDANRRRVGLHAHVSGLMTDQARMGGLAGALRIRPVPHIALDFGVAVFGGEDYMGLQRADVPLTLDVLFYVNPQRHVQFYLLGGVGYSFGVRQEASGEDREMRHVGAELGAGFEFRMSRAFALNVDFRAFARRRVDDDSRPEYVDYATDGTIARTTDTSVGATFNFGGTVYFGR